MSKIANPTKVITGVNTRRSYANVWDPKSINGAAPKYSVSLIIPKSDTVTVNKIKAAIQAAYEEGESKLKGTAKVSESNFEYVYTPHLVNSFLNSSTFTLFLRIKPNTLDFFILFLTCS